MRVGLAFLHSRCRSAIFSALAFRCDVFLHFAEQNSASLPFPYMSAPHHLQARSVITNPPPEWPARAPYTDAAGVTLCAHHAAAFLRGCVVGTPLAANANMPSVVHLSGSMPARLSTSRPFREFCPQCKAVQRLTFVLFGFSCCMANCVISHHQPPIRMSCTRSMSGSGSSSSRTASDRASRCSVSASRSYSAAS